MTSFVLDASAGVELLLNSRRAQLLIPKLPASAEWWVPEHYFVEVTGALRRAALNTTLPASVVESSFRMLERSVLRRVQVRPLLDDAWRRRTILTIGDALYVVLAERLGATLVTTDLRLAKSHGMTVPVITP